MNFSFGQAARRTRLLIVLGLIAALLPVLVTTRAMASGACSNTATPISMVGASTPRSVNVPGDVAAHTYWLSTPANPVAVNTPVPLVLYFHPGKFAGGLGMARSSATSPAYGGISAEQEATRRGFAMLALDGYYGTDHYRGYSFAANGIPNLLTTQSASDTEGAINAALTQIESVLCVDTSRVYVMGGSGGGMESTLAMCHWGIPLAAAAPWSGVNFMTDPTTCTSGQTPLIAAMEDGDLLYDPDATPPNPTAAAIVADTKASGLFWQSTPTVVQAFASRNGCGIPTDTVVATTPHTVTRRSYANCAAVSGTQQDVELYTVNNTVHLGEPSAFNYFQRVFDFFDDHPFNPKPTARIATSDGQNSGVQAARFRVGVSVTFTGAGWSPNLSAGSINAELCDVTGANCVTSPVTANMLATDANGTLSGGFTVPANSYGFFGAHYTAGIKLTESTLSSHSAVVAYTRYPNLPSITVSPAVAGVGSVVRILGRDFNPNQPILVQSLNLGGPSIVTTDPTRTYAATDANGDIVNPVDYAVNAGDTNTIGVAQGSLPPNFNSPGWVATSGAVNFSGTSVIAWPARPIDVAAEPTSPKTLHVTWDPDPVTNGVQPDQSYLVTAVSGSGNPTETCSADSPTTSCDLKNLVAGDIYSITVTATNTTGTSNPSTALQAVPLSATTTNASSQSTTNSSTPAVATNANTTATASGGTGSITVADFASNPLAGVQVGNSGSAYLDVRLSADNTFTSVTVTTCLGAAGSAAEWWDANAKMWRAVSPAPIQSATPSCPSSTYGTTMTFSATSSPSLSELYGTPFQILSDSPGLSAELDSINGIGNATAGHVGDVLAISGSGWGFGPVTIESCNLAQSICDSTSLSGSFASGDFDGSLAGTATIAASSPLGARLVRLTQGSRVAIASYTVLTSPTLFLSPSQGATPVTATANGANWSPGSTVTLQAMSDSTTPVGSPTSVSVDLGGVFSTPFTITSGATTLVRATSGSSTVDAPFNVQSGSCIAYQGNFGTTSSSSITNPDPTPGNPNGCFTEQDVLAAINPGTLRQDVALAASSNNPNAATIDLGSTPVSASVVTLAGVMNPITVQDTRGGVYLWSLTAAMTTSNFVNTSGGTGVIPVSNLTVGGRTCTPLVGSAPGCPSLTVLGFSPFGGPVSLAYKNGVTGTTGSTSGSYVAAAILHLDVPAFSGLGQYKATLRVTLA